MPLYRRALLACLFGISLMSTAAADRIRPYADNPRYWQLDGAPVLLIGGTVKDCLFQIPDLEAHLDLLRSVGGNYIRNTMSDRPTDGYEIKAFHRRPDGLYDLDQWNDAYWQRFADLLKWTAARRIVVQIEIWDRFDHSREPWQADPFNPKNNVNYTHEESGLAPDYPDHPGQNKQPFFYTIPALEDNRTVLPYQQAFVERVLSYTLPYGHVLYCMDNETSGDPAWGAYWNTFIKEKARQAGVEIETTEMWDQWDVKGPEHRATLDHPQTYSFVDISQNSWQTDQANWDNAQWVRRYLDPHPRPINSTKIYGAQTHAQRDRRGVTADHAIACFWRNLIGGLASSRFHRPPSGIGLSPQAQSHIRAARLLADRFDFFNATPDTDHALINDRHPNEAYLTHTPDQYALYFPHNGQVTLNLPQEPQNFTLQWLDIPTATWTPKKPLPLTIPPPSPTHNIALIEKK